MLCDPITATTTTDFTAAQQVVDYWQRSDREDFLFYALMRARTTLWKRKMRIPPRHELERIVVLAYQSAWILVSTSFEPSIDMEGHVRRFILEAVRAYNRRERMNLELKELR